MTTVSDDMAVWVPSARTREVPPAVCDMFASEHGISFRASVVISAESTSTGRRDDSFPPDVLVSSSQRFTTETVQLAASSSIQEIKVVQPCYELEDLCLSSTQIQRLALRVDAGTPHSKDSAVSVTASASASLPAVVSLKSLQQYAVPFLIQHSQHQHNRRAVDNVQSDLACQSALVVAGPVSSGKSTAAAIALAALLYNRKSSWFTSQTPIVAAASPPQGASHHQGDRPAASVPSRPLTGRVLALVLVSSREAEELWRGLLEKQLTPIYDRGSNHNHHNSGIHHQSRPNVVVGRSVIDHAAAVGGTLVNGRYHSYPNGVSPVVIVQNVFQLDGLGKAWSGRGGDGRIVDLGGMPIGFLNTVETVVLDGVESILTPPLSSTIPLGVWTLLRRLSQRGLKAVSSSFGDTEGASHTIRSREAILEEQRSLPYVSRHGFTAMWILSSSHTCTMLGASSSSSRNQGPIGFHSAAPESSSLGTGSLSRQFSGYYSTLQNKIDSQAGSPTSFIREEASSMCCDVESGRYDAYSTTPIATIALSPLMAGNMHRNLIRLVGGLLGRGVMLECGQAEVGRWHSVVHRVALARSPSVASSSSGGTAPAIEAPPLASLIAHSISKIGKGTTVVVVRNKNDATALSTIVRLILTGAMKMSTTFAFPAEWWCGSGSERVLKFPVGNRNGAKTAKDLYTAMCALKSTALKNGSGLSLETLKLLKSGAENLLKSTPPTASAEEGSATQISAVELFDNSVVFVTEWHVKTGTYPKKLVDVRHVINCLWDIASYRHLLPPMWQQHPSSGRSSNNSNNNAAAPTAGPPNITFELEGLTHTLSHLFGSHSYMNLFTTIVTLDSNTVTTAPSADVVGNKRERAGDSSDSGSKATDMLCRLAAFLVGTKQPVPLEIVNAIEDISLGL